MSLTPYDWNQSIQTRSEYIEERLRDGSPVVGISLPAGVLLVSIHRAHRKIFEIYDRLVFSGIGNQSDVEMMRNAAIDFAHREGFSRSPDDVTVQRLVGSSLSPALKKAFGDPFTAPFVFRGLYAELGETQEADAFYALGYDGEYRNEDRYTVIAGTPEAENSMIDVLQSGLDSVHGARGLEGKEGTAAAVKLALEAWGTGRMRARRTIPGGIGAHDEEEELHHEASLDETLREAIADGKVEAALLERNTARESKFRLLREEELAPALREYR